MRISRFRFAADGLESHNRSTVWNSQAGPQTGRPDRAYRRAFRRVFARGVRQDDRGPPFFPILELKSDRLSGARSNPSYRHVEWLPDMGNIR